MKKIISLAVIFSCLLFSFGCASDKTGETEGGDDN